MFTETDILNNALILIGEQPVLTVDTNTVAGRRFIQVYELARDQLLRSYSWNFAIKRVSIAALISTPEWGFNLEYELPSDFLHLLQVGQFNGNMNGIDYITYDNSTYKIEGGKILTNISAPLDIRYVRRVTVAGEFDPLFVNLLITLIAIKLNNITTNNAALIDRLSAMYKDAKSSALRANAFEKASQSIPDGDWIISRL